MSKYTREAFKSLDLLEDTDFDLFGKDNFQELDDFISDDIEEPTEVVDLEAETEEDIKDSYVGEAILSCPICHTNLFKPMEEIVLGEEDLCCVDEECPICGQIEGFKIIGKVAPFEEKEEIGVDVETEPEDDEVEIDVKEKVKESFKKRINAKRLQEKTERTIRNKKLTESSNRLSHSKKKTSKVNESLEDIKSEWENMRRENIFEFPSGDYVYVGIDFDKKTIYAGGATNTGIFRETEIDLDEDDSLDGNLIRLYDTITEEHPEYFETDEALSEAVVTRDVTDQVVVKRSEPGFISKMHELRDKGYECISSGNGQMVFAKPKVLKTECAEESRDAVKESLFKHYTITKRIKENKNRNLDLVKKLNEDLKIFIDLSQYKPWSGAVDTWNKIIDAGLIDELESILEDLYPEGLGQTELNDILWFDADWVLESLGLAEEEVEESLKEEMRIINTFQIQFDSIEEARAAEKRLQAAGYGIEEFFDDGDEYPAIQIFGNGFLNKDNAIKVLSEIDALTFKVDESLKEDIEKATIETEDQVIEVKTEPKEEVAEDIETVEDGMIAPISDEDIEEIEANQETEEGPAEEIEETPDFPEEEEFEFESLQRDSFDRLAEEYLKKVYSNVKSFEIVNDEKNGNQIKLEGKITFNSGRTKNTTFIFEKVIDKGSIAKSKMRFVGLNETFTTKKNAYVLSTKLDQNSLVAESLRYDYPAKTSELNESVRIIKGFVK